MEGKNVLYVEDEAFFASIISKKLQEDGFQVDVASDGAQGWAAMQKKKYDLVLLDLILPELGGFEVLEKIKSDPNLNATPVVILSNLSTEEDKKKAKELGAHSFYVKINSMPNEILALVRRILGTNTQTTE